MILLTQCAVCATELGLTLGKKCGRCSTRYCGAACQVHHWKEGGHDQLCKKIKKAGGAEQYNANNKYAEAVTVAAKACAEDTKGQTCFICTQAVHWKTKEGLVRGCSCRGSSGLAHVSCLAEQAKILVAEAEENNLDPSVMEERFQRWYSCSLCKQEYHGVVRCALGWACWKTYVGRPEADWARRYAMTELGTGLHAARHYEDELSVREAELAMRRRLGDPEELILVMQGNLAGTHHQLGRSEEALRIRQDVYSGYLKLFGKEHEETLREANNYAGTLKDLRRFEEAKALLRRTIPVARRALGASHITTLRVQWIYAQTLYKDDAVTLDDLREAVTTLEEIERTARRVLGGGHPTTAGIEMCLREARVALRAREAPRGDA
jgi:tetratricopeptide (TPR) repeat protein